MVTKKNSRIVRNHHLSHTTIVSALFFIILIFTMGESFPLQQPHSQHQEVYATSQGAVSLPQSQKAPPVTQAAPFVPTPICNPSSPILQFGSTGAKVLELQRALTQVGYGSLLGQKGIDGKFGASTQNAVKKLQQDYRIPVDGKVGPITWGTLCRIVPNSFIIQLKFTDRERMGTLINDLVAAGGKIAIIHNELKMLNVRFERPLPNVEQFINSLKAYPAVQRVSFDAISTASQAAQPIPEGVSRVDADLSAARSGDGQGVVDADIAIIDSGVNYHPDLNVYQCWSFLLFDELAFPECYDKDGHGTEVAGAAAAKDNTIGVVGTAPGARIWALKTYEPPRDGPLISDEIKALNFVSKNADKIEVVNLSLAGFGFIIGEYAAILDAVVHGVVVVVAAGNDNIDARFVSPAMYIDAITVSAITDSDGRCGGKGIAISQDPAPRNIMQLPANKIIWNPDDFIASYSNFGSPVDLAAPGTWIDTTTASGSYDIVDGTSFAAPAVAGAAALYKSLHPSANPYQVDAFLKSVATKAPASGNPLVPCDGAGRGYFNDKYPGVDGIKVLTGGFKEPLLNMANIK
jgi:subtilisin family serine protease